MAIQVFELAESDSQSTQDRAKTNERTIRVVDDDPASTVVISAVFALSQPTMPAFGSPHPYDPTLFAADYRMRRVPGTAYGYDVTWTYKPGSPDLGGHPEPDPEDEDFVGVSIRAQSIWVDGWRSSPDEPGGNYAISGIGVITIPPLPLDENTGGNPDTITRLLNIDIGGVQIDSNGEPVSIPVTVIDNDLTHVVSNLGLLNTWSFLINGRNNASFLGYPVGTLVYKGFTVGRIGIEGYRVTHTMTYDQKLHLRQAGWRHNSDGRWATGGSWPGMTLGSLDRFAFPVRYVQPYPFVGNFATLGIPPI